MTLARDDDRGAGIAVGHATLGRIGFEGRYDYGALGSVTNLAARLSDEALSGQILLSQRAYAALEERVEAQSVAALQMKGFAASSISTRQTPVRLSSQSLPPHHTSLDPVHGIKYP